MDDQSRCLSSPLLAETAHPIEADINIHVQGVPDGYCEDTLVSSLNRPSSSNIDSILSLTVPDNSMLTLMYALCLGLVNGADAVDIMSVSFIIDHLKRDTTSHLYLNASTSSLVASSIFVGMLLGSIIVSPLSSKVGRKSTLIASLLCTSVGSLVSSVSPTIPTLIATRFISGCGIGGAIPIGFTYASEVVKPGSRHVVISFMALCWVLGSLIATGLAWLLLGAMKTSLHVYILSVGAFPTVCLLLCALVLPESPHYLANRSTPRNNGGDNDGDSDVNGSNVYADQCMDVLTHISTYSHRMVFSCCSRDKTSNNHMYPHHHHHHPRVPVMSGREGDDVSNERGLYTNHAEPLGESQLNKCASESDGDGDDNQHVDTLTLTLTREQSRSLLVRLKSCWTNNDNISNNNDNNGNNNGSEETPSNTSSTLTSRPLSTFLISLCAGWFLLSLASYGFSLWVPSLFSKLQHGDDDDDDDPMKAYQNTFIYSLAQLPGCFVAMYVLTVVSKVRIITVSNIIGTIAMAVFCFYYNTNLAVGLVCICMYQMCTTAVWTAIVRISSLLFLIISTDRIISHSIHVLINTTILAHI